VILVLREQPIENISFSIDLPLEGKGLAARILQVLMKNA